MVYLCKPYSKVARASNLVYIPFTSPGQYTFTVTVG